MSLCCFFLWPVLFCKSRCFKLSVQRHVSLRCPLGLTPVKAHTPPIRPLFFLPGAHRALPLDGAHCAGVLFPLGGAPRCLWCSPSRGPPPPPWSHSDRSSYPSMLLTEPGRSSPSVILLPLRDAPPPPWSHGDGSSYPSMVLTELGYSSPSVVLLPLRDAPPPWCWSSSSVMLTAPGCSSSSRVLLLLRGAHCAGVLLPLRGAPPSPWCSPASVAALVRTESPDGRGWVLLGCSPSSSPVIQL